MELNRQRPVYPRQGSRFVPETGPVCPRDGSGLSRTPSRQNVYVCWVFFLARLDFPNLRVGWNLCSGKIKTYTGTSPPLFSKKAMPWGKKWPVQMNLPFFAVKPYVPGGVQNQAEKNSKNAFRPVPVQKFTFPVVHDSHSTVHSHDSTEWPNLIISKKRPIHLLPANCFINPCRP